MRRTLILGAMLGLSLMGCATAQVRKEASVTLNCPEGQISLEDKGEGKYWATGCGRGAVCEKPAEKGAEATCAGGGPLERSPSN